MQKLSKPSEYASDNSDLSRSRIFTETRMDASVQSGVIAAMDDIQAVPTRRQTRRPAAPTVPGQPSDRAARRIFSARRNGPFSQTLRFVDGARVKLIARIT